MPQHESDGFLSKKAGAIFHLEPNSLPPLHDPKGKLKGGTRADRIERPDFQAPRLRCLHEGFLEEKVGLQLGPSRSRFAQRYFLQNTLERCVAMRETFQQLGTLSAQKIGEFFISWNIHPKQ